PSFPVMGGRLGSTVTFFHLRRLRRGDSGLRHDEGAGDQGQDVGGDQQALALRRPRAMKGPVRSSLATVLAAAVLASAIALAGSAAADETEPEITSWMLPPSTRPVWGLLDVDRVRGSGQPLETVDSLTGNWRGYRDRLSNEFGLSLVGDYTSECAGNPVGGRRQGVTYTHNTGLALFADPEKLLGRSIPALWAPLLHDTAFLVSASNRAGRSLSAQYIGNVYAVQQIFGGQTTRLVHLAVAKAFFR